MSFTMEVIVGGIVGLVGFILGFLCCAITVILSERP